MCVHTYRYGSYSSTAKTTPSATQQAGKPATVPSAPSYMPSSASYASTASYTSTQEKVIANYIAQKTAGGGGAAGKFAGRKPYNPSNQTVYFCDICKISCASSMVGVA